MLRPGWLGPSIGPLGGIQVNPQGRRPMEHKPLSDLSNVADLVPETPKASLTRRERLERWIQRSSSAHMTNMPVGSWLQSLRRTSSWASTTRRPSGGAEPYVSRDLVTRRGGKQCTPPHSLISDAQKRRERLLKTSSGSGLTSQ